jgi:hypothetical protein
MTRIAFAFAAAGFLVLASTPSFAGIATPHLTWDDCWNGSYLVSTKQDSCANGPVGPHALVISITPLKPLTMVNGAQGYIDVTFAADHIPDFWQAQSGGCANGMLTSDVFAGHDPPTNCPNPWDLHGGQVGAFNWAPNLTQGNNRARITWIVAIPYAPGVTMDPAVAPTWSLFRFRVAQDAGTCSGCQDAACFRLTQARLTRPAGTLGGDYFFTPYEDTANASWQADSCLPCSFYEDDDPIPCPTPTMRNTWGQLKSLFR